MIIFCYFFFLELSWEGLRKIGGEIDEFYFEKDILRNIENKSDLIF